MSAPSISPYHRAAVGPLSLAYHGRAMNAEPTNMALADVAERLRQGHPVYVDLQPGDGTRYEFVLLPLDGVMSGGGDLVGVPDWEPGHLMVTRLVGPDPVASVIISAVPDEALGLSEFVPLSRNNEWTVMVLEWWTARLFLALHERGGL
jgi:hypothetical protein